MTRKLLDKILEAVNSEPEAFPEEKFCALKAALHVLRGEISGNDSRMEGLEPSPAQPVLEQRNKGGQSTWP